jgi:dCMP deaminase
MDPMTKQEKLDALFMDMAVRISEMSYSQRSKVGVVLVKGSNVISMGWNGRAAGVDNTCEIELPDGSLVTRPDVYHAEENCLNKLTAKGGIGAEGAELYTTLSPCPTCAKQIKGAGVTRVIYRTAYRLTDGLDLLKALGVTCDHLPE